IAKPPQAASPHKGRSTSLVDGREGRVEREYQTPVRLEPGSHRPGGRRWRQKIGSRVRIPSLTLTPCRQTQPSSLQRHAELKPSAPDVLGSRPAFFDTTGRLKLGSGDRADGDTGLRLDPHILL